jgi:ribosomal protein S18 acetylase RimI-like enzyme
MQMADSEGKVMILVSSNTRNVSFYRRHGFQVYKTLEIDGATDTVMFRKSKTH